jgi:hypothetical protein
MTATSANDVWAIGNLTNEGVGFSLFEHFDGTAWTATTVLARDFQSLSGASADAIDDAWAVGFKGVPTDHTFATHWDGKQWKSVATPNAGNGRNRLRCRVGTGAERCVGGRLFNAGREGGRYSYLDRTLGWNELEGCAEPECRTQ